MSDDPAIPSLASLDELANRIVDLAAEELDPEQTTLEVTAYADGDYRIEAYETVAVDTDAATDGTVLERVAIRYDRRREWIQRLRYRTETDDRVTEDRWDLEPYADPVVTGPQGDEAAGGTDDEPPSDG